MTSQPHRAVLPLCAIVMLTMLTGCGWRGINSLPLPGTAGGGPGSYTVQAELPDVTNIQPNSRVRVNDVTVGNVVRIQQQGWHALVTMTLDGKVKLPANATAKVGQTSLLGTMHIELSAPPHPNGQLHDGSVIPLSNAGAYPTTEQTLASVSLLLNGGGLGHIADITQAFSTAFRGREQALRDLTSQAATFTTALNQQRDDIISASDSLNRVTAKFANQKPVVDRALQTIPEALAVLSDHRDNLANAFSDIGKLSATTNEVVTKTRTSLTSELKSLGPVLKSLADAGPAMTRSLSLFLTYPWPNETITKWFRGDFANLSLIVDLTLSRLDATLLTGTRYEGNLTKLELLWGRTIGQIPSPYTAENPLIAPYHLDQGP